MVFLNLEFAIRTNRWRTYSNGRIIAEEWFSDESLRDGMLQVAPRASGSFRSYNRLVEILIVLRWFVDESLRDDLF